MTDGPAYTESIRQATEPTTTPTRYLPLPLTDEHKDSLFMAARSGAHAFRALIDRMARGAVPGVGVLPPMAERVSEPDPRIDHISSALRVLADLTVKTNDATERVLDHVVDMAKRDAAAETLGDRRNAIHMQQLDAMQQVPPSTPAGAGPHVYLPDGARLHGKAAHAYRELEASRDALGKRVDSLREQRDAILEQVENQRQRIAELEADAEVWDQAHRTACRRATGHPISGLHDGQVPEPVGMGSVLELGYPTSDHSGPWRVVSIDARMDMVTLQLHPHATGPADPKAWAYTSTTAHDQAEPDDEGRLVLPCVSKDGTDLEVDPHISPAMTPYLRFVMAPIRGKFIGHHMARADVRRLRDHLTAVLGEATEPEPVTLHVYANRDDGQPPQVGDTANCGHIKDEPHGPRPANTRDCPECMKIERLAGRPDPTYTDPSSTPPPQER